MTRNIGLQRTRVIAAVLFALFGAAAALGALWTLGVVAAGLCVYLMSRHALVRSIAVIGGGLALLGRSSDVTIEKFIYLGAVLVAIGLGLPHIARRWDRAKRIGAKPLLVSAGIVVVMLSLSSLVALASGVAIQDWALDSAAYWLLAAAVPVGLDLGVSDVVPKHVVMLLLLAGIGTAVGYTIEWWARRHVVDSGITHLLFPSIFLAAAAFSVAVAYGFSGRRTVIMGTIAAGLAGAIIISGTRIALFFFVPLLVILLRSKGRNRLRLVPLGVAASVTIVTIWSGVGIFAETGQVDLEAINGRILKTVPLIVSGDAKLDPSLYGRSLETSKLFEVWTGSPWFGVGPGHRYDLFIPGQIPVLNTIWVDSPLVPVARFGVVGMSALLALLFILAFGELRRGAARIPADALFAFMCMVCAFGLVSSSLDDKGLALGLVPLIAFACRDRMRVITHPDEPSAALDASLTNRRDVTTFSQPSIKFGLKASARNDSWVDGQ